MNWALLALLLGCGARQAPPDEPAPEPEATPQPAEDAPPEPRPQQAGLFGDWVGAPCGSREYERLLTVREDGTWAAEDRVSPCPPDVVCVWSGIVLASGTWTREGDALILVESEADRPAGVARPTRLSPADGGTLTATEAAGACPYAPAP